MSGLGLLGFTYGASVIALGYSFFHIAKVSPPETLSSTSRTSFCDLSSGRFFNVAIMHAAISPERGIPTTGKRGMRCRLARISLLMSAKVR
jgi:hypothetical protein